MTIVRVQHSLQGSSGLPEDRYVNTFHFRGVRPTATTAVPLADAVRRFYTETYTTQGKLFGYLGTKADAVGSTIKIFDLADPSDSANGVQREPIVTLAGAAGTFGPAGANSALPEELAVCLSYRGAGISGLPAARRRGRLYIGPLSINALGWTSSDEPKPNDLLVNLMVNVAKRCRAEALAAGYTWSIYSPTASANVDINDGDDLVASAIDEFWVDDAFDVQRRRGRKPAGRVTVPAV